MINTLIQECPNLFTIFQKNIWESQTKDTVTNTLQSIADLLAEKFGCPQSICDVKIVHFNNPSKKGEFNSETGELLLEYDLVINNLKPPYRFNNHEFYNALSNKDTFETFIHEFRHALQNYCRKNLIGLESYDYMQLLYMNDENRQNRKINSYFVDNGKEFAKYLYMLQPTERDAFLFANDICRQFNDVMHMLYPNDDSFSQYDEFSYFTEMVSDAKIELQTQTPFDDIDDIIRYINGIKPFNPLNQKMWEAVQKTQSKSLMQQLSERFSDKKHNCQSIEDRYEEYEEIERK